MEQVLLNVIALPAIEETLVDWLLERHEISGFSSSRIDGHGTHHSHLSMSEQVAGRQKQVLIQIQTTRAIAKAIITDLEQDFAGTDVHYWLVPVLKSGHMGDKPIS